MVKKLPKDLFELVEVEELEVARIQKRDWIENLWLIVVIMASIATVVFVITTLEPVKDAFLFCMAGGNAIIPCNFTILLFFATPLLFALATGIIRIRLPRIT